MNAFVQELRDNRYWLLLWFLSCTFVGVFGPSFHVWAKHWFG